MRRNLALAALLLAFALAPLLTPSLVRAQEADPDEEAPEEKAPEEKAPELAFAPIDRKELRTIERALGDFFQNPRRPPERLAEVDRVIRELDEERAENDQKSLLADMGSLREWVQSQHNYDRLGRSRRIRQLAADHPENVFNTEMAFFVQAGSKYRPSEPAATILLIPDSGVEQGDVDGVLKEFLKDRELKRDFLVLCPALPAYQMPVKLPDTPDEEEQARREAKYARELAVVEEQMFQATIAPLKWLFDNANVDRERLYVVGLGDGAARAARVGATWTDLFAGVIVQNYDLEGPLRENLRPILYQSIRAADAKEVGEKVAELIVGDEAPTRNLFPKEIDWRFNSLSQQRAFWSLILVERPDEANPVGRLKAKIDGNTVSLETSRVEELRLFFNDDLVDLDRPVTVVVNGQAQEPRKLERSFRHMIEWAHLTGDLAYLFPASVKVVVPVEEVEDTAADPDADGEGGDTAGDGDGEGDDGAKKGAEDGEGDDGAKAGSAQAPEKGKNPK